MKPLKIGIAVAIACLLFIAPHPGSADNLKADVVTSSYDLESIHSTTFRASSIYYDWQLADNIRLRAGENWQKYYAEVMDSYIENWQRIDNSDLTLENLADWTNPIVRNLTIVGEWKLENSITIPKASFLIGATGYRERATFRLPQGYFSFAYPTPLEVYVKDNREIIVYETEKETRVTIQFTNDQPLLFSTYISEKLTGFHFQLIQIGLIALAGLCIAENVLVLIRRRARASDKDISPDHFLRLARASGIINGIFLTAAGFAGLNLLGAVLIALGVLMILVAIIPKIMFSYLSKIRASLNPTNPKHLAGTFVLLNLLWLPTTLLSDTEFQRTLAPVLDTRIPLLLASVGIFVVLTFLLARFIPARKKRGFRTSAKTRIFAVMGKLGITRPGSFKRELGLGLLVAMALVAVFWPVLYMTGSRGILFGDIAKRMTVFGSAAVAMSAGFWVEILLRRAIQPRFGLVLSSLLFGAFQSVYGSVPHAALSIFAGLAIGMLYQRRGNVFAPIVAHSAYNLANLLFLIAW
jgi:membrane protease YdiL (CAAX protease family)